MGYRLGVVGATGLVGEVLLGLLQERAFPLDELRLFSSSRSAGRQIEWGGERHTVEETVEGRFGGLDVVVTAAGSDVAREWVPRIRSEGPLVLDNSSAFRQERGVPLVIPEINASDLQDHDGLIANPNCTATAVLMAVAPLHEHVGVRSMTTTSFQSVSGTGRSAMTELLEQVRKAAEQLDALRGHEELDLPAPEVYPHHLAFNVLPQCETFPPDDPASTEEQKMQSEARKILSAPDLDVHATAVRVPVVVGHAVAVSASLAQPVAPDEAARLIGDFPGVRVVDAPAEAEYPTPLRAAGSDETFVGRIRSNPTLQHGISLFVCQDNLRKGAALNNVQILESLESVEA